MDAYTRMRSMSTDFTSKPAFSLQLATPTPATRREEEEEEEEDGLTFGLVLGRSCSSASQGFANGSSVTLPTALKRAFSMRRSSSVREGYWRIHDTNDEIDEGKLKEEEQQHQQQVKCSRSKKKGKILRACRRIFGL